MANFDTTNAKFNSNLEELSVTDRAHASVFNERFKTLIKNDVALKNNIDEVSENIGNSMTGVNTKLDGISTAIGESKAEVISKIDDISLNDDFVNSLKSNINSTIGTDDVMTLDKMIHNLSLNKGVIKSVQFVTGGASGGTTTVTFSPVDLNKTIFILSDSVRNMDSYSPLYLKSRTTTSVTIASGSTSTSGAFSLQVIEFN